MHKCIVMMNLPCKKLPFSWSCIANCIMETSTYYSLKILVYSSVLWNIFMVHSTFQTQSGYFMISSHGLQTPWNNPCSPQVWNHWVVIMIYVEFYHMINLLTMLNKILVHFQRSTLQYWLLWHTALAVSVLSQYCWDVAFQNQCVLKVTFWNPKLACLLTTARQDIFEWYYCCLLLGSPSEHSSKSEATYTEFSFPSIISWSFH